MTLRKMCIFWHIFCILYLIENCDLATIITTTPLESTIENYFSTVCSLPENKEAYCVPIRSCLALFSFLTPSEIRGRRCGPRNESSKNPAVCCEKDLLYQNTTFTESPLTLNTTSTAKPPFFVAPPFKTAAPEFEVPSTKRITNTEESGETCGFQYINSRIYGGEPASEGEFPWLGRLLRRDSDGDMQFSCTGSLITAKAVLTSAHCLTSPLISKIGELYAVSFGEHETRCSPEETTCFKNKKTVMISRYIAHPRYLSSSKNHDHDIGLVILRDKVTFTNFISPICLLASDTDANGYVISGWGKTESDTTSAVKLKTNIPTFKWEECAKKYQVLNVNLTSHHICAGGVAGYDACQGDSGGPLMVQKTNRWYVAGIVSFGVSCGKPGWPGIYIYVPKYIDWIRENVQQYQ